MSYFSRLTDIVTCNLTEILATEADPRAAIEQIIHEMEEGLAGAERSVNAARNSEQRLQKELEEHQSQMERWNATAKQALASNNEEAARRAIQRRQEIGDVTAGLEHQHQAAVATREHLVTMKRAISARLSEARRKLVLFESGESIAPEQTETVREDLPPAAAPTDDERAQRIEDELAELKRELQQGE